MTYSHHSPDRLTAVSSIHFTLLSFPVACFSLTALSDLAYLQTVNLLWVHFSEWLLLAGLVFGVLAAIASVLDLFIRRVRPPWLVVVGGIVVLLLATLNSLIHTADGWTAVVPWGLTLSLITVLAMIVTGWFGRMGVRHV